MKKHFGTTGIVAAGLFIAIFSLTQLLCTPTAKAAYDSSRLIDDMMFLDSSSMNDSAIQSFIISKGGGLSNMSFTFDCAIAGTVAETYYKNIGAPCGQKASAATIIYYAAQIYGVNPKVILASLQKEQSLITTPNPDSWQINQAMGFGCPDSGGCSSSSSFFYQIDNGTWSLRFHMERARGNMDYWFHSTTWVCGSTKNYYSPNLYPNQDVKFYDDGGTQYTTVHIANAATSSLYCYTPHVYNNPQGLYGLPVMGTTGQYYSGSYSFVYFFERWFNSTHVADYHWSPSSQNYYTDSTMQTKTNESSVAGTSRRVYVTIRVLNDGAAIWKKNSTFLGTSNSRDRNSLIYDSSWVSANRAATLSEESVAPGSYGSFSFWANTPSTANSYREYFNLVVEGVTWMNDNGLYLPFNVEPAHYTWSPVSQEVFSDPAQTQSLPWHVQVVRGDTAYARVRVRNTGNVTWYNTNANPIRIASSSPNDHVSQFYNPSWINPSRPVTLKESSLAPGEIGTFTFQLQANYTGNFSEHFNVVVDGKTWMNDVGLYFPITVLERQYGWTIVEQSAYSDSGLTNKLPYTITTNRGTPVYIKLVIRNTGNVVWNTNVSLATSNPRDGSSRFYDPSWLSGNRLASVKSPVGPGETTTITARLLPSQIGSQREYLGLVWDGQQWFNDIGLYFPLNIQ